MRENGLQTSLLTLVLLLGAQGLGLATPSTNGAPGRPLPARQALEKRLKARLVAAMLANDDAELSRAAMNLGNTRVQKALNQRRDRLLRQAAIAAAPFASQPWSLLPLLVRVATHESERQMASRAALATRQIGEGLRQHLLLRYEADREAARWGEALLQGSYHRGLTADIRVSLILALAALANHWALPLPRLRPLLQDPHPDVRRAAIELFADPARASASAEALLPLLGATTPNVRIGAATALCGLVHWSGPRAQRPVWRLLARVERREQLTQIASLAQGPADERAEVRSCVRRLRHGARRNRPGRASALRNPVAAASGHR